jgi:hypothetical protein
MHLRLFAGVVQNVVRVLMTYQSSESIFLLRKQDIHDLYGGGLPSDYLHFV